MKLNKGKEATGFALKQKLFALKRIACKAMVIFFLTTSSVVPGQNYTYRTYLNDNEIAGTIKHSFTIDTIRKYIGGFYDRLGYEYYLYQSALKYSENKAIALNYLDTAFARGLDTLCVPSLIKQQFGQSTVNKSYSLHYLKTYDLNLKQQLDSLEHEDQKYRMLVFEKGKRKQVSDSIMALWKLSDSSNVIFFKNFIKKHGYPTAKKIGYDFCAYERSNPELIIMHLGKKERDFQIAILKQLVELCLKNEEHWQKIDCLQFNLHNRFSNSYSEFTFLYLREKEIDVERSLFSLWVMAKILQTPFKTMYVKCSSEHTFNDLKKNLIDLNQTIPLPSNMKDFEKWGLPIQKKMNENQLVFEIDKSLPADKIYYKITYK
jgi:hypothetical protein